VKYEIYLSTLSSHPPSCQKSARTSMNFHHTPFTFPAHQMLLLLLVVVVLLLLLHHTATCIAAVTAGCTRAALQVLT
jgi:hypothetical protein